MNHFGLFSPKYTLHKIKCHTIFSRNFHYNKTELQNPIMINPRVKRFPVFVYLEWKLTHISLWKIMIYVTVSFFSFCYFTQDCLLFEGKPSTKHWWTSPLGFHKWVWNHWASRVSELLVLSPTAQQIWRGVPASSSRLEAFADTHPPGAQGECVDRWLAGFTWRNP